MIFKATTLKGAFLIEPERRQDALGFFSRTWCQREFGLKVCRHNNGSSAVCLSAE
jgi:dTDP-4-dehydrorhamnose 3,5-epimerase-like enzyme